MSYKIIPTPNFKSEFKTLLKKYPKLIDDLREFTNELQDNPTQGTSLGSNCYKIRMKITGKQSGKSGGARVIINVEIVDLEIYLISIYDKADQETITDKQLKRLLKNKRM